MDRQEIKSLLNYLENNPKHLNSLQRQFLSALKEHYKSTGVLTQREIECLNEIKGYIPSVVMEEEAVYESEYPAQYSSFDYGAIVSGPF